MCINKYVNVLFCFIFVCFPIVSQNHLDTTAITELECITVSASTKQDAEKNSPLLIDRVQKEDMEKILTGNLIRSLDFLPGVQSMNVGSAFSKPMIRGAGFNRVSVVENGVKQEGQQWGADHGLEIDAFNVEQINIQKGPSSLLFGSDAMGGVVEIIQPKLPQKDMFFGSVDILARSVNVLLGGSVLLGFKKNNWFLKVRYSEQHFGDYSLPVDTIVYLSQKIPVSGGVLNNTAGFERSASSYLHYANRRFSAAFTLSDTYQKAGFFPAAHGIPDPSEVEDDGNRWNIALPNSFVNHFKASLNMKYLFSQASLVWDIAYQNNHREEWSLFHTHYNNQTPPSVDSDKELAFILDNYSSNIKLNLNHSPKVKTSLSWDIHYQKNRVAGYSFLLPNYDRFMSGLAAVTSYSPTTNIALTFGLRYDIAKIKSEEYIDKYLGHYLSEFGYKDDIIQKYIVRSYNIDRLFGDYSLGAGISWMIDDKQSFKANIGRSYRLPGANELASNGVHHSSFMHEQGDSSLNSEQGWQLDLAYEYATKLIRFRLTPFVSYYENYIYLRPTGEWSILPHAGQIYRYSQSEALFTGAELSMNLDLPYGLGYELSGEYIYTYNIAENIPLSFSPPTEIRNKVSWEKNIFNMSVEWHYVFAQNRVARNELKTPSVNLFNLALHVKLPFITKGSMASLRVDNIFNMKYLNHLSYYRKVEIPEPGRNIQLTIKIPFEVPCKTKTNNL